MSNVTRKVVVDFAEIVKGARQGVVDNMDEYMRGSLKWCESEEEKAEAEKYVRKSYYWALASANLAFWDLVLAALSPTGANDE